MTLATRVIGKSAAQRRLVVLSATKGCTARFPGKMYDHADYPMFLARSGPRSNSVLAGPTCDSIDVPYENIALPLLEIGDLLVFESMGAYTTASASQFQRLSKSKNRRCRIGGVHMNKMVSYPSGVGTSLWIQNLVHGLAGITIKVKHTVFCASSPFQKIEVFDTYRYGRCSASAVPSC